MTTPYNCQFIISKGKHKGKPCHSIYKYCKNPHHRALKHIPPLDKSIEPLPAPPTTLVVNIHFHLMEKGDDYYTHLLATTSPDKFLTDCLDKDLEGDQQLYKTLYLDSEIIPPIIKINDDSALSITRSLTLENPLKTVETFCFNAQNAYLKALTNLSATQQFPLTWEMHLNLLSNHSHQTALLSKIISITPKIDKWADILSIDESKASEPKLLRIANHCHLKDFS